MEAASSYDRNDAFRSAKNGSTKNNREQQDEKNNSNLLTIYSFISSYVFKEDMNYDENDSRYELLESQDLENESYEKKVSFSEYNEKVYRYYRGRSGSDQAGEVEDEEYEYYHEEEDEEEGEDEGGEDDEEEDDEEGDNEEDNAEDEEDEGDCDVICAADSDVHAVASTNGEDIIVQGRVPRKKGKSRNRRKKGTPPPKNNMTSMKDTKYRNKLYKKGKKNKIHNVNEDSKEDHSNGPIKRNINNISKYFMLSMDNINEQENIFKDEKQLSRQMSYYNDAYYYTSEMIYKNNKRHKEKFALYLRLMSLFVNIMIGIYLITHFPHTNNEFEMNSQNRHSREHENLKEVIRNRLDPAKNGAPKAYGNSADAHMNALTSQSEVLQNNEKKRKYLDILFRGSFKAKEKEKGKEPNSASPSKDENSVDSNKEDKDAVLVRDNSSNPAEKNSKESAKETPQVNNQITEIDIINLIDGEYIMNYIYLEMNKIYKYAIYSFFGELLVISIIVFSLFILRIIIKDNNKFSVILTMYGILYKIFCYIFAHYVLVMGLYILSIYYNIYVNSDIYEHNFNFFCYHYVCNNLHIHFLMLFYAFQNIIFTINDAFNCIRMMFIIFKHVIVRIYEKITCKNFITFYELKEDKSPLSLNCMNKFKKRCNMNNKCCRDKTCVEIDIDEIHELEYDKSQLPFPSLHQKPYCKNLDIKTYEQSLLNMRNPIFK